MVRKPVDIAHINLRIRESLRRQIEREAKKNRTSLNSEIRLRLEYSLEQADRRDLETITADMKITWAHFRRLFLLLEEKLAQALAQTKDRKPKLKQSRSD